MEATIVTSYSSYSVAPYCLINVDGRAPVIPIGESLCHWFSVENYSVFLFISCSSQIYCCSEPCAVLIGWIISFRYNRRQQCLINQAGCGYPYPMDSYWYGLLNSTTTVSATAVVRRNSPHRWGLIFEIRDLLYLLFCVVFLVLFMLVEISQLF